MTALAGEAPRIRFAAAQSIIKASAAASGAGNFTAATDISLKIREILNGVINVGCPRAYEVKPFKSQQAMTMQL